MAIFGPIEEIARLDFGFPNAAKGFQYLRSGLDNLMASKEKEYFEKVEIDGNDVYAVDQIYPTKPLKQAKVEAHQTYIDLQYVAEGEEVVLLLPLAGLTVVEPYDKDRDVAFYGPGEGSTLLLRPGLVAVFFPWDGHAPGLRHRRKTLVRKSVVKVRVPRPASTAPEVPPGAELAAAP